MYNKEEAEMILVDITTIQSRLDDLVENLHFKDVKQGMEVTVGLVLDRTKAYEFQAQAILEGIEEDKIDKYINKQLTTYYKQKGKVT